MAVAPCPRQKPMNRLEHKRTNPLRALLFAALLLMMLGSVYAADPSTLHIRFVQGEAEIKTGDNGETIAAEANAPVLEGDKLWLFQGARMELLSRRGTLIRLDGNSFLAIESLGEGPSRFHLDVGRTYVCARDQGELLSVTTPGALVRAEKAAVFALDVSDQGQTALSVFEGSVVVEQPAGNLRVGAGRRVVLDGHGGNPQVSALASPDEWEGWNRDRDHQWSVAAARNGQDYLPEELQPYTSDFATTGEWFYAPPYGYIWRPFVVGQPWAPYRLGYWRWVRQHYVWISYEPWGWVPYHYGRWVHHLSGWCWVPPGRGAAHWGPGYVGWMRTTSHVAWVPLAPHEQYRHPDFSRPHTINANSFTNRKTSGQIYQHQSVKDAMTIARPAPSGTTRPQAGSAIAHQPRTQTNTIVPEGLRTEPTRPTASLNSRAGLPPNRPEIPRVESQKRPISGRAYPSATERDIKGTEPAFPADKQPGALRQQGPTNRLLPDSKPRTTPSLQRRDASRVQDKRYVVPNPGAMPVVGEQQGRTSVRASGSPGNQEMRPSVERHRSMEEQAPVPLPRNLNGTRAGVRSPGTGGAAQRNLPPAVPADLGRDTRAERNVSEPLQTKTEVKSSTPAGGRGDGGLRSRPSSEGTRPHGAAQSTTRKGL